MQFSNYEIKLAHTHIRLTIFHRHVNQKYWTISLEIRTVQFDMNWQIVIFFAYVK